MTPKEIVENSIKARYPIIAIDSYEEERVLATIKNIAIERNRYLLTWDVVDGLKVVVGNNAATFERSFDPLRALDVVRHWNDDATKKLSPCFFVFNWLDMDMERDYRLIRALANLARSSSFNAAKNTLFIISPNFKHQSHLDKMVKVVSWDLPNEHDIETILKAAETSMPDNILVTINGNRQDIIQALRGLTAFEIENALYYAVAQTHELGACVVPFIIKEKEQIIKRSGVLEFYDKSASMNDVGGLRLLKEYALRKKKAFSANARAKGIDTPKGVLLVGIPGTGKSLAAKAIAGGTMPLLRLDIGALMNSLMGASEANMRTALKVAEAVSPCVLWMDEMEKGLSSNGGELDGGTSQRLFGTLLTWMQECTAPVYVVATCNSIEALKPELLRRFDDIVFVDLPNQNDRIEVIRVHLNKRGYNPDVYNLDELANAVYGFTGAEIEKVVREAIENAFYADEQLSSVHLMDAAKNIIPLSVQAKGQIDALRAWARDSRARLAADALESVSTVDSVEGTRLIDF